MAVHEAKVFMESFDVKFIVVWKSSDLQYKKQFSIWNVFGYFFKIDFPPVKKNILGVDKNAILNYKAHSIL